MGRRLLFWVSLVLVAAGCGSPPPPASPEARGPSWVISESEFQRALGAREPYALRDLAERAEELMGSAHLPADASEDELALLASQREQLQRQRELLRAALLEEVARRVRDNDAVAVEADSLAEAMRAWQVGSFYLGLLPDPTDANMAEAYQGLMTAHQQTYDKLTLQSRLRYTLWAVREMKKYIAAFEQHTAWRNDVPLIFRDAKRYLGPIDSTQLSLEGSMLYQNVMSATLQELKSGPRAQLVELLSTVEKRPRS